MLSETIGWITQLVVDANERRKRIATTLFQGLVASSWFAGVTMMGIASTHPAALNALCNMLPGRSGHWASFEPRLNHIRFQARASLGLACRISRRTLRRPSKDQLSSTCRRLNCGERCSKPTLKTARSPWRTQPSMWTTANPRKFSAAMLSRKNGHWARYEKDTSSSLSSLRPPLTLPHRLTLFRLFSILS